VEWKKVELLSTLIHIFRTRRHAWDAAKDVRCECNSQTRPSTVFRWKNGRKLVLWNGKKRVLCVRPLVQTLADFMEREGSKSQTQGLPQFVSS